MYSFYLPPHRQCTWLSVCLSLHCYVKFRRVNSFFRKRSLISWNWKRSHSQVLHSIALHNSQLPSSIIDRTFISFLFVERSTHFRKSLSWMWSRKKRALLETLQKKWQWRKWSRLWECWSCILNLTTRVELRAGSTNDWEKSPRLFLICLWKLNGLSYIYTNKKLKLWSLFLFLSCCVSS